MAKAAFGGSTPGPAGPQPWPTRPVARYQHEAWVWTIDELDDGRWFGGPLTAALRQRLGDVALVPFLPVAYQDPADTGEMRLMCRHGSLTPAEMLVPCLAAS